MPTKVYGASDDLIEFDGDVSGEIGNYGTDDSEHGELIILSDGTLLEVKYGKADMAIWGITVINKGPLLKEVIPCSDEDADPHSDIAIFNDGLKWAYGASEWEKVS